MNFETMSLNYEESVENLSIKEYPDSLKKIIEFPSYPLESSEGSSNGGNVICLSATKLESTMIQPTIYNQDIDHSPDILDILSERTDDGNDISQSDSKLECIQSLPTYCDQSLTAPLERQSERVTRNEGNNVKEDAKEIDLNPNLLYPVSEMILSGSGVTAEVCAEKMSETIRDSGIQDILVKKEKKTTRRSTKFHKNVISGEESEAPKVKKNPKRSCRNKSLNLLDYPTPDDVVPPLRMPINVSCDPMETETISNNIPAECNAKEAEGNNEWELMMKEGLNDSGKREYQCAECPYHAPARSSVRDHIKRVHLKIRPFECGKCTLRFFDKHTRRVHNDQVHLKIRSFKCTYCRHTSLKKTHLKQHVESVHLKLRPFKCEHCSCNLSSKAALTQHVSDVHLKVKPFMCNECEFRTGSKYTLKQHVNSIHLKLKTYKCPHCKFACAIKSSFRTHMNSVHAAPTHVCTECNFKTYIHARLKRHIQGVHLNMKPFSCPYCSYTAVEKGHINRHVNWVHLQVESIKCEQCEFVTSKKNELKRHVNAVHLQMETFPCSQCDYVAFKKQYLKPHYDSVHLKLRPHKCDLCNFTSAIKPTLKEHYDRVHLKLRPYICDECEFSAFSRTALKVHSDHVHSKTSTQGRVNLTVL